MKMGYKHKTIYFWLWLDLCTDSFVEQTYIAMEIKNEINGSNIEWNLWNLGFKTP